MLGGLPRPEVQVQIGDPDSMPSARLDFYYPAAKLGIEFDGDHHRASLVEDNRRQNAQVRQALMPERPVGAKRTSAPKSAMQAR